ncbi:MAG: hypothetical protein JWR24_2874 [Actinoallomurus sp.]|jgi:hypothetical protein|nr:hypothetical protein [Actinoallomurus sp.]
MELNGAQWRKSSRSADNGGQCVELAVWRTSSRSGDNGGQCVQLAVLPAACDDTCRDDRPAAEPNGE